MLRRDFLTTTLSAAAAGTLTRAAAGAAATQGEHAGHGGPADLSCCLQTYPSPAAAMKSEPERLAYVAALYTGTGRARPDYLATVDVDPRSRTYSRVIHRLPMPGIGDELHHYGWNMCSSCHGVPGRSRQFLIVPGFTSGNLHVIDVRDPARPRLHKVIEGRTVAEKTGLMAPHTVHCTAEGTGRISTLGDTDGNGPGGFLVLDPDLEVAGRWEESTRGMRFNYDFWYQPRHNVMVSSEWAAPKTFRPGFDPKDVEAGRYGHRLCFWDWTGREIAQTVDLGDDGRIPLDVRFHHDPDSTHGFVGETYQENHSPSGLHLGGSQPPTKGPLVGT